MGVVVAGVVAASRAAEVAGKRVNRVRGGG